MDLHLSPEDHEFRERARTWLEENVPRERRPVHGAEMRAFDTAWQQRMYDGGFAGVSWPAEYGGQGLSLVQQMIWFEEYAWAAAPWIGCCFVGVNHAGPTLMARGTPEQCAAELPAILRGDVVWCQGFSEPGAGSDLAAVATRAVVDGDELVVNGSKIWTSFAQLADRQELLVRTGGPGERHRGLTWVIGDMHAPGVTITPIASIEGWNDLCQVFYDDVRLPLANVVGQVGDGWSVAMSTLSFERGTGFIAEQVEVSRRLEEVFELARRTPGRRGGTRLDDDSVAGQLAMLRAEVSALQAMTIAVISRAQRDGGVGVEGSLVRLFFSELLQRVSRTTLDVLEGDVERTVHGDAQDWWGHYARMLASTIAAGSKDIQRNLIGERMLGLPR